LGGTRRDTPDMKREYLGTGPQIIQNEGSRAKAYSFTLRVETSRAPEFVDITEEICTFLRETDVMSGLAVIYSLHTTAAIRINEKEPLLLQDMEQFLERIAPKTAQYKHNDFSLRTVNMTEDECPNGHAHCQHLMLSSSETVPILNGVPQLGQWQRIFLIELDRPRQREILVNVLGI